jgi:hypothetical protein
MLCYQDWVWEAFSGMQNWLISIISVTGDLFWQEEVPPMTVAAPDVVRDQSLDPWLYCSSVYRANQPDPVFIRVQYHITSLRSLRSSAFSALGVRLPSALDS